MRYPDLIVAFGVDPEAYYRSNAYIISEQGKPPDFVLEIASPGAAAEDAGSKPADYAALGTPEYWRFNEKPTSRNPAEEVNSLWEKVRESLFLEKDMSRNTVLLYCSTSKQQFTGSEVLIYKSSSHLR